MKLTRRYLLAGSAALVANLIDRRARAEPALTEDGLYKQSWFLESFLELPEDLQGATNLGKRFAIMWELRGCPYCRETHLVNFARREIEEYIKSNFEILQLYGTAASESITVDFTLFTSIFADARGGTDTFVFKGGNAGDTINIAGSTLGGNGVATASPTYMGYVPAGGLLSSSVAQFMAAATNPYVGVPGLSPGALRLSPSAP